jgi:ribosomal protein S18 acetylase RimI-like enzyme
MIKLVDGWDREALKGIYESEFNSELPSEEQANIVACIEDDELLAFVTAETLIRTDMWWIAPPYRKSSKAASLIRKLARYLFQHVPKNSSVVIFARDENQGRLFKKLGFREVPDIKVYRLDR